MDFREMHGVATCCLSERGIFLSLWNDLFCIHNYQLSDHFSLSILISSESGSWRSRSPWYLIAHHIHVSAFTHFVGHILQPIWACVSTLCYSMSWSQRKYNLLWWIELFLSLQLGTPCCRAFINYAMFCCLLLFSIILYKRYYASRNHKDYEDRHQNCYYYNVFRGVWRIFVVLVRLIRGTIVRNWGLVCLFFRIIFF